LPGLVVDDRIAAVDALLDAVGARAQPEAAGTERNVDRTADLRIRMRERGAALRVPDRKPPGDAQEARPPERARLRIISERCKTRPAEPDQDAGRIGRQTVGMRLREVADRVVDEVAAVARARRRVDRIERRE